MHLRTITHAIATTGVALVLTVVGAPADAAVCHTCEDPTLPPPGGGESQCTVTWTSDPVIGGTPRVGVPSAATPGSWSETGMTATYQWFSGNVAISGATSTTYTPTPDKLGQSLRFRVRVGKSGCTPRTNDSEARTVALGDAPTNTSLPVVTGTPEVGAVLTLTNGTWTNPNPTGYTYRWLRNGAAITGATGSTYTLTAADANQKVRGVVTAVASGHQSAERQSTEVTVADNHLTATSAPTISGSASVGSTLTASDGTWNFAPASLTHQWLRDGTPIQGATTSSYVVTTADQGHALTVEATATRPEYVAGSAVSAPLAIAAAPAPASDTPPRWSGAKPALKGKARVGKVLRLRLTKAQLVERFGATTVRYQWFRGAKKIRKATKASYRLTRADRGKKIRVKVIGIKAGHPRASVMSKALRVRA